MENLLTADAAFNYFITYLEQTLKQKVKSVVRTNKDRHMLIKCFSGYDDIERRFYILYKKECFMTFSDKFNMFVKENKDYEGFGESINKEWLDLAVLNSITGVAEKSMLVEIEMSLIFIYPDGSMFEIHPKAFEKFAEENGLVRVQDKFNELSKEDYYGGTSWIQESTYHIPISLLRKIQ